MAIRLTESNAVFYEIPRTGTTFVRETLSDLGIEWTNEPVLPQFDVCPRHSPPWAYSQHAAFRFTTVRNPLDWYESFWTYHGQCDHVAYLPGRWYAHRELAFSGCDIDVSFRAWVDRITHFRPAIYTRIVEAFCGPCGMGLLDTVMRTEALNRDLERVLRGLGYDVPDLSEREPSNTARRNISWTLEQKRTVLWLEQPVMHRFYS